MNEINRNIQVWGGLECTFNRVGDEYFDQLAYSGHYHRGEDLAHLANLGFHKMRYPVLWEKHCPNKDTSIDWTFTTKSLNQLRADRIEPIVGLVHHGSGPEYVSMLDDSFAQGLARYAGKVAERFPWLTLYTPVNEPLTTARFCGLYGLWYPHRSDSQSFCRILVSECKATVLAMQAIRKVNSQAKLVQTEDLGKVHSTSLLSHQADFENERRWLAFDLLCGKVNPFHPMWNYLEENHIEKAELDFFLQNPTPPSVIGCNHYLTSERYLDQSIQDYPAHTYGENGRQVYADVEAVRIGCLKPDGLETLLTESWNRYSIPLALTEVHLHCTREEQMRWLKHCWSVANRLLDREINILAITPWALLGSYGWNRLLTEAEGDYESGVFDVSEQILRPTILGSMIQSYSRGEEFEHPLLHVDGWWERDCRIIYPGGNQKNKLIVKTSELPQAEPLLVFAMNESFPELTALCNLRGIGFRLINIFTITDLQLQTLIQQLCPWGALFIDLTKKNSFASLDVPHVLERAVRAAEKADLKLVVVKNDQSKEIAGTQQAFNSQTQGTLPSELINKALDLLIDGLQGHFDLNAPAAVRSSHSRTFIPRLKQA